VTKQFWCEVYGCSRSDSYSGQKRSFSRKDKRDEHMKRAHKAPRSNEAAAFGICQTIGLTGMGMSTDAAGYTWAAHLPGPTTFHDAGGLIGVTDLAGRGGFAGFSGVNLSACSLGSTDMDGPSIFSPAAGIADTAEFAGFAGSANDDSSELTRLIGIDGLPGVNESTGVDGVTGVNGFSGVDTPTGLSLKTNPLHFGDARAGAAIEATPSTLFLPTKASISTGFLH